MRVKEEESSTSHATVDIRPGSTAQAQASILLCVFPRLL